MSINKIPIFNDVNLNLKDNKKIHKFWDTQPIIKTLENNNNNLINVNDPIENKTIDDIRKEPYILNDTLEWYIPDIENGEELGLIYKFLSDNYVEDKSNTFRFNYNKETILWSLTPPGWNKEWNLIIRIKTNKNIVGFISMVPSLLNIYNKNIEVGRVNYLCVHKKLREKGMAPILIKEITRQSNLKGCFVAIYTSGTLLPNPMVNCSYYHRYINIKKLIEVGFTYKRENISMKSVEKLYDIKDISKHKVRELDLEDIKYILPKLNNYLSKYHIYQIFNEEEFKYWFITRKDVVYSYVIIDKNDEPTDFFSFYKIPSQIIGNNKYKTLNIAYSFYNIISILKWEELMEECLIQCKKLGFDVYNCLDLMDNREFLNKLKFEQGNGKLKYYIYNWKCPITEPNGMGLVLI